MTFLHLSSVLLTVFVAWLVYYVYELIVTRKRSNVHLLAYPSSPDWLWGHEKETMYDTAYGKLYSKWFNEKGEVLRIKGALWYGDILVVADPQALFYIEAKNVYNYRKTKSLQSFFDRVMGRSLLSAEGDEHKRMRGTLNSCFTAQKVREMQDVVHQCAEKLVSVMSGHVNNEMETGTTSPVVDITKWNSSVTLDIIGRVGFRQDFGLGKSPEAQEILRTLHTAIESTVYFSGFLTSIMSRAFPFIMHLPFESLRKQELLRNFVRRVGKQVAEEKMAHLASGGSIADENKDLLSYIIEVSHKEGQSLNVDELLAHIVTFVIAGLETTATTLSFAIHSLAHHSDIQTQLRKELLEFGREPTFDDLHNKDVLKVLDAITKESWVLSRFHRDCAHTERVAVEDDVIPLRIPVRASDGTLLNSIAIRKGQMVVIPCLSINTRPGVWGPDGEMFRPSRWLEQDSGNEKTRSKLPQVSLSGWNSLTSFSEGAHMCIGYRLAVIELKTVLASLVKAFVFEEVPGPPIKNRNVATLMVSTMMQNVPGTTQAHMKVHHLPVKVSLVAQH